jgi:methylisocitrate lyase
MKLQEAHPGQLMRQAVTNNKPLVVMGVINAYFAVLAEEVGFKALYLSGAGVANASYGLPDLGLTCLEHVLEDAKRILSVSSLPLMVDIDTGWDSVFESVKALESIGAAGVQLEDQVSQKRCGHRPNKKLVTQEEMMARIRSALDARENKDFIIMARTDAVAVEGIDAALQRAINYTQLGADMIFVEALTDIEQYSLFRNSIDVPILANMTEFGKTPIYSQSELGAVGVDLVLYPLSVFRSASAAALKTLRMIYEEKDQKKCLNMMQTREELYYYLNYHHQEKEVDVKLHNLLND